MWAWGRNGEGQDGNPQPGRGDTFRAVRVLGLDAVTSIAAGSGAAYARRADGTVWSWGDDRYGDLGDGRVADGQSYDGRAQAAPVAGLTGIQAVAAGDAVAYALRSDGTVWGWGGNGVGQLGTATAADPVPTPVAVNGIVGAATIAAGSGSGLVLTGG